MNKRQQKGFQIAQQKAIKETKGGWLVKSESGNGFYRVSEDFICDCRDSELHNSTCKHAYAVRYYLNIEKQKPTGMESEKIRLTYKQAWSVYNKAQTNEGHLFDELLRDLVFNINDREQRMGRPHLLLKDNIFIAIKKVYSQVSSRRSISLFGIDKEKGLITHTPHFNSIQNFLSNPIITPILHDLIAITSAPLREVETEFAIDSTGFRTRCFGAYCEGKYPSKREHIWIKLHASCGVKTNIITSVEIKEEYSGDSPELIPLTQKMVDNGFAVEKVFADKGYLSRENLNHIEKIGATQFIPFKENSVFSAKGSSAWRKMYFYFKMNQEEFLANYHKRSNIESTFAAMKKKLGDTLRSKNKTSQINELLCKVIAYNITVLIQEMEELGIKPNFTGA
ncbi:MAG: transposase [Nitrosotalea sp.]